MLLVTESLTLMAGTPNRPSSCIWLSRWTPVVVSSVSPLISSSSSGVFWWTIAVRSPPSSRIMFSGLPSAHRRVCSMHQSNSSSVIPFHAKTGTSVAAIAAAAWSWVEKILQLDHCTWAPRAVSVSISTAVWMVMCRQPAILAPASGWLSPYLDRSDIRPGISVSANSISRRPHSANDMSATL